MEWGSRSPEFNPYMETSMIAARIAAALKGRRYGTYYVVRCPAHDDRRPSLLLRDGDRPGRLLVSCRAGCDARAVLDALRALGLLKEAERAESDTLRGPSPPPNPAQQRSEKRGRAARIGRARAIWKESRPATGTIVERYLLARGLTLPVPPTLRFHPALRHGPSGLEWPAMVAAVQAVDRSIVGVHRTFLAADGSGKAPVADAKLSLGAITGGAVRLAAAAPVLAVGEGIETCLAFAQVTEIATWSALSTSGLKSVVLPPLPLAATVYVIIDSDPPGEAAAHAASVRFVAEGRAVKLARPVSGKDIADSLTEASRGR